MQRIANFFHFEELGTNYKTEILAGLTTFVSMAYILFVNPQVLGLPASAKGPSSRRLPLPPPSGAC